MAIHNFYSTASIVVFVLCFRTGISDIILAPSSREVQLGGSTYFNCSTSVTSLEIHWFHYPASTTERSFVYGFGQFYNPYLGRFAMDKNATSGEYNLVVTSVVAEDVGKYECQDDAGSGMKKSAHLIILDTDLMCQSNVNVQKVIGPNLCAIEPDLLILTCMVQYYGNEAPILQWRLNDNNESIANGVTRQINDNRVICNLTMTTDEISYGSFYLCRTTRSNSKISCNSGKVQVVGSTQGQETSGGDGNCDSLKNAIICICVLLLLPLSVAVVVLTLMLIPKLRVTDKETTDKVLSENESLLAIENEHKERMVSSESAASQQHPPSHNEDPEQIGLVEPQVADKKTIDKLIAENGRLLAMENDHEKLLVSSGADKKTIEHLTNKNERLLAKVNELEQKIYGLDNKGNKTAANLVHTIDTKAAERDTPITGLTILENSLFVVKKNCPVVEVYDSKTFVFERLIEKLPFTNPLDIASSKEDKLLYVINRENSPSASNILKFKITGEGRKMWATEDDNGRLSTYESNLIVCFSEKLIIIEYSPKGEAVNTVRLSPGNGFNNIWHAIKLTGSHFAVSHSKGEDGQRVCVVDINGNVLTAFEELPKFFNKAQLPICLVGHRNESVLVADAKNKRVLLLNPKGLEFEGVLMQTDKSQIPVRLCLNETRDWVFVAVNCGEYSKPEKWKAGRILIYKIKKIK